MKPSYTLNPLNLILFILLTFILTVEIPAQRYWNTAAKFEGSADSYILVVPYSSLQNLSGSFTVETWFYCEPNGSGTLFGKNGLRLLLDPSGSKVRGRMQTNNNTKLYTRFSSEMETNRWYHLACSYNSVSGLMSFFINGAFDTSVTSTNYGPVAGTDSLLMGTSGYGSFKGMLDDVRIWNRDLTQNEIQNNMRNPYVGALNSQNSNFGTGIVMSSSFDFTYTSGGGLYFYDGYNSYTNMGAASVELGMHPSKTNTVNSSLDLTNGGYAKMPSNPDLEFNRPITAEAWIYPLNSGSSSQYILRKGSDYGFYLDDTGKMRFVFSAVGVSTLTIPSNQWTHIAIVCDQTGIGRIYINGTFDIAYNFGSGATPGTDTLYIGAYNSSSEYFNGYIDAVKISNYAKSEEEIKKDMFRIIDWGNRPQPPNSTVSINFDYQNYSSSSNGGYFYYAGNAKNSITGLTDNIPVSPLVGNNVQSFPDGFFYKYSGKRIPQTNTAGYLEVDSLNVSTASPVADIQLFIALNHSQISDLQIFLQSPSGDSVMVWNGNFGINNRIEHIITVFDDNADSSIINGTYVDFGPYIKPFLSLNSEFSGDNPQGTWKLKITDLFNGNTGYLYGWGLRFNNSTGVEENYLSNIPVNYTLAQNYPNPFNPTTTIKYSLPVESSIRLVVYNILGKKIATLVDGIKVPGTYSVLWDGKNDLGDLISSGVYIYRIEIEGLNTSARFSENRKMILLK